jgi:hypothetical protein
MYQLSRKSKEVLNMVNPPMIRVIEKAISISTVDFGVSDGLRTIHMQQELVNSGRSQTMNSNHLHGDAVDLKAYIAGKADWTFGLYIEIAEAVRTASIALDIGVRWGGAWNTPDLRDTVKSMADLHMDYIQDCIKCNRKPFADGVHFELI